MNEPVVQNDCSHPKGRLEPTPDPRYSKCQVCQEVVRSRMSREEILDALHQVSMKMTPSHIKFCDEWLRNGKIAVQAYLTVFKTNNYGSACTGSKRLMKKVSVQAYLELMQMAQTREVLDHLTITRDRILDEEAKIAFADVRQMFDSEGNLLHLKDWPEELARCVDGVEVKKHIDSVTGDETYHFKYKLNNKGQALQRLQKCLGMHIDTLETGDNLTDAIRGILDKADGMSRGILPIDQEEG